MATQIGVRIDHQIEVLLDVNDVALGHTAVVRWNRPDRWVESKELAHEALIEQTAFDQVQEMLRRRARTGGEHRAHRSRHPYVFKSLVYCGCCGRKIQAQHSHDVAYYRCRYPQEYAVANKIVHPRSVILREDAHVRPIDTWLVQEFSPLQRRHTVANLVSQAQLASPAVPPVAQPGPTVAECDGKLARYRAALEAGADPAVVAGWIAETQAARRDAEERELNMPPPAVADGVDQMTEAEIITILDELGDLVTALGEAEPEHKLDVYRDVGLRLVYDPEARTVRASVDLATHRWDLVRVRRGT